MNYYVERIETPFGGLAVAVDQDARLIRIDFVDADGGSKTERALGADGDRLLVEPSRTAAAACQLREYFAGKRRRFDLDTEPRGSDFQKAVWGELLRIPYGGTRSYSELAGAVGRPGAARAVGRAVATNPISIVVPCHRVVGSDGSLTGYAGGLDFKQGLLALEGSPV
ncbi:MAG: methylated-DNA--[protein]-cysteine S-methyltransferase [bacterium]|nr:methylated-DNA--[protein]-cysteine S-methyltransferase [bacterium]